MATCLFVALAALYRLDRDAEVGGYRLDDYGVGDLAFGGRFHHVGDGLFGKLDGDGAAGEVGERDYLVQAALKFADVLVNALGQKVEHCVRRSLAHLLGFGAENGDAGFDVRGLYVHDQAAREPGLYPVFEQRERGYGPVGREDYLAVGHVQGVEGVEESFLGLFFAYEELDVVEQEKVGAAVAFSELVGRSPAYRLDVRVGELLGGRIYEGHTA